jgi:hypothetical protein
MAGGSGSARPEVARVTARAAVMLSMIHPALAPPLTALALTGKSWGRTLARHPRSKTAALRAASA